MSDVLTRLSAALESRYRVGRQIGIGGMATVYLAHDLRHERDVAIKVLHPDLAAALGAERFLAEIKTTAKLQHPHILPLLDSGEADGLLFYVMPYIAGESLRNRLERETQLAVDDAVRIAREVASAIESAHKHGVVHRDIKPENILLHEDQALVADFGIALAVSAAGGARMTQTGLSLGTPQYMAPEQAMGERAVDGRADIYALGAVLYEMLVGEAPFTGPTVQAIVARVMTENPRPVTGQRRSVPAHVNAAILKALEKLPADRFHSAAEFSKALVTPGVEPTTERNDVAPSAKRLTRLRSSTIPWAIAGVTTIAAIALWINRPAQRSDAGPIRLAIDLPSGIEINPQSSQTIGISPDGSRVVFVVTTGGRSQLVIRNLNDDKLTDVQGSTDAIGSAEFSPDGKWLAFNANGRLNKVPANGGPPTAIGGTRWGHIAWLGNDALIFTKSYDTGLSRLSAEGSDSVVLSTPDRKRGELGHWWPQVLPDGKRVIFTAYSAPADQSTIEVMNVDGTGRKVVLQGGYFGRYVDGYLLFIRNNVLMKVAIDGKSLKTKGSPVPLSVPVHTVAANGWAALAVSTNGTLAYMDDALNQVSLKWVDEGGNETAAFDSAGRVSDATPSPDGKKIGLVRNGDVWTLDRQRGILTRLTSTGQHESNLRWTPDSRELLYVRDAPTFDIFKRVADASRPEEQVLTSAHDKSIGSVSPDGRLLLFTEDSSGSDDIFVVPLASSRTARPVLLVGGPKAASEARFSPDGMWIVYNSRESGRNEIYLSPFPLDRGPAREQLSVDGGSNPEWGPDGRTVYFDGPSGIMRVRVNPRTGEIGRPEALSKIGPIAGWTIGPDGRFLVGRSAERSASRLVRVILNWTQTLPDTNGR